MVTFPIAMLTSIDVVDIFHAAHAVPRAFYSQCVGNTITCHRGRITPFEGLVLLTNEWCLIFQRDVFLFCQFHHVSIRYVNGTSGHIGSHSIKDIRRRRVSST